MPNPKNVDGYFPITNVVDLNFIKIYVFAAQPHNLYGSSGAYRIDTDIFTFLDKNNYHGYGLVMYSVYRPSYIRDIGKVYNVTFETKIPPDPKYGSFIMLCTSKFLNPGGLTDEEFYGKRVYCLPYSSFRPSLGFDLTGELRSKLEILSGCSNYINSCVTIPFSYILDNLIIFAGPVNGPRFKLVITDIDLGPISPACLWIMVTEYNESYHHFCVRHTIPCVRTDNVISSDGSCDDDYGGDDGGGSDGGSYYTDRSGSCNDIWETISYIGNVLAK